MKNVLVKGTLELKELYENYKKDKNLTITEYDPTNHLSIRDKRKTYEVVRYIMPRLYGKTFIDGDIIVTLYHDRETASLIVTKLDPENCMIPMRQNINITIPERLLEKINYYCERNNLTLYA